MSKVVVVGYVLWTHTCMPLCIHASMASKAHGGACALRTKEKCRHPSLCAMLVLEHFQRLRSPATLRVFNRCFFSGPILPHALARVALRAKVTGSSPTRISELLRRVALC